MGTEGVWDPAEPLLSLGCLGMQWMILELPGCSHPEICTGISFSKRDPAMV